ncbi:MULTISPECIES: hypothetical protein [Roseicyclus]|jgi:hypothetical protein|uniref:hypothetical protein n=1 Tax=Roseicyclus amphidinii TaxID=3034232 RepID=UPI0024E1782B|nr:hypothetical protein [Roseicyclus sp. Amp-Y-6]
MFTQLRSTLPALMLSAVVALGAIGASATPARADNGDAARIIGGIIALYAIGRAIESANRPQQPARNYHVPSRPRQLVAPARCFIEGHDRNGYYRGYVRRCMENNARHPQFLPANCLTRVHTPRGERQIYAGRCLAQNGWVREAGFGH